MQRKQKICFVQFHFCAGMWQLSLLCLPQILQRKEEEKSKKNTSFTLKSSIMFTYELLHCLACRAVLSVQWKVGVGKRAGLVLQQ